MDVAVIGAGPAGLMAAETLATNGARVMVYDRMPSVGRKFLLAGRGGLNLTHSEPLDTFLARYGKATLHLRDAVEAFPPDALRDWSQRLGQSTFVGTSGRVFPEAFKASPLLRAWLRRLDQSGVQFALRHTWTGWTETGELRFDSPEGERTVRADATILALGGGSWPRLGSDGGWIDVLQSNGIASAALQPANCGFRVAWSDVFRDRYEGQPLKGVTLSSGAHTARGDMIVTRAGIEGGAVYAISAPLREAIDHSGQTTLRVALRPDLEISDLVARLSAPRNKQSLSTYLRKQLNLSPVAIGLLQEATIALELYPSTMSAVDLARFINDVPVKLIGIAPLERAISTAGGISFDEIDAQFMLRKMPGVFVAGEMLDWEAPTGGYLLQACFATGVAAGRGALAWLAHPTA